MCGWERLCAGASDRMNEPGGGSGPDPEIGREYLRDAHRQFRGQKRLVEKAIAQVSEKNFFAAPDARTNSIALVIKHMAGNMRSRWTDFLDSDGEKPDRNRDAEFELEPGDTKEALLARWEAGWRRLFAAIEPLAAADLTRTVFIRGEDHSVVKAINRQLTHLAYHAGQIALLARHYAGDGWQSLSIPRGQSEQFNAARRKAEKRTS